MILVVLMGAIIIYPFVMAALWCVYKHHGGQERFSDFMHDI